MPLDANIGLKTWSEMSIISRYILNKSCRPCFRLSKKYLYLSNLVAQIASNKQFTDLSIIWFTQQYAKHENCGDYLYDAIMYIVWKILCTILILMKRLSDMSYVGQNFNNAKLRRPC
jgi:hypothetical protein